MITAATASLLAVGLVLGSAKNLPSSDLAWHIALSVSAVVLSWTLVHTLFALRYAHLYFWDARKIERKAISGGLIFPGKDIPDYLDFAYFSFVIGMTCQVSDVQIACSRLRRPALVHGLISLRLQYRDPCDVRQYHRQPGLVRLNEPPQITRQR